MTPMPSVAPPRPRAFFSRWQLTLIFATALVAANGVAWFVFHVKTRAAQRAGTAETRQEDGDGASRSQDGDEQPGRTKADEAKADREAVEALHPALGLVTTIGIRQAYLNVGVLADAVEGEVYEASEAAKVLEQVESDLTEIDRQLGDLMQKVFDAPADRKAVTLARQALQLIRTQARELRAHWDSNTKESAERFQKARKASWDAIEELRKSGDD
jgi:hypothetical protein